MSNVSNASMPEEDHIQRALGVVNQSIDTAFDRAPVMMHSLDRTGRIVKVNRRWLQRLGFKRADVLGRKSIDFLTQDSREWAIRDALPLFWNRGLAEA